MASATASPGRYARAVSSRDVVLPDLSGKRALVTGATGGLGLEIARTLAKAGAHLVLPARNPARAEQAVDAIRASAPDAIVEVPAMDLTDLASVRDVAAALTDDDRSLDILVLNAGIALVGVRERRVTDDGFELHFQTNFLGHAVLTLGLLPLLRRSRTRIAVQGSVATGIHGVEWNDLRFDRRYAPFRAYASSKTALSLFGVALAGRVPELRVDLCHPGVAPATGIAAEIRALVTPRIRDYIVARIGNPPAQAIQPALLALTTDAPAPAFCAPCGLFQLAGAARLRRPYRRLREEAAAQRAWELAQRLAGPWVPRTSADAETGAEASGTA